MVFWRKKKHKVEHEQERQDEQLLHPVGEPDIRSSSEEEVELPPEIKKQMLEEVTVEEIGLTPVPEHSLEEDNAEAEDLRDHSDEGGWLSRLTSGLAKSSSKITQGIGDLVSKKKLDQDTLEQLEDLLIEADLGPVTAAKIVESFSQDRFGKDISEEEVSGALAESISKILIPVAQPLVVQKPANGPYVILMCGVNGAGKTTTIGKLAHQLHFKQGLNVMMAAGDTFRAAATEQLSIWAERVGAKLIAKDVGADSAAVAFEAYRQATEQGADVLLIDTAGRLQNKTNLMEELQKIIRVLKKQNTDIPHATLLVLDATTGQNAFSQVGIFKEMVDVTGLIVTKLDGSAKGGVLVGLADQFQTPVHAIGVGESVEDMQPFCANEYAQSLVGIV